MDLKNIYNAFYQTNPNHRYDESLIEFINVVVKPRLDLRNINILDLGCGHYSVFEDLETGNSNIYALDISVQAISQAPSSKINYLNASITSKLVIKEKFDLVFDSHCFNSLVNDERSVALFNIHEKLIDEGLFCSQMMVNPIGSKIKSNQKTIKSVLEVEKELLSSGFKIIYFLVSQNHQFSLVENGSNIRCDLLRIVAKK